MALTSESALRKDQRNAKSDMQHRHFATVAAIISNLQPDCYGIEQVARHFADELRSTNPRFDRARFLKACGVTEGN